MSPQIIELREAAKYVGRTEKQFRTLVGKGLIVPLGEHKPGEKYLFSTAQLEFFLAARNAVAVEAPKTPTKTKQRASIAGPCFGNYRNN